MDRPSFHVNIVIHFDFRLKRIPLYISMSRESWMKKRKSFKYDKRRIVNQRNWFESINEISLRI